MGLTGTAPGSKMAAEVADGPAQRRTNCAIIVRSNLTNMAKNISAKIENWATLDLTFGQKGRIL